MKPIRVFNRTLHKEMWNWLADNPFAEKSDWPGWERFNRIDRSILDRHFDCFACLANDFYMDPVFYRMDDVEEQLIAKCKTCPLEWGTVRCADKGSPFYAWLDLFFEEENEEELSRLARQIANLPLRGCDDFATIVI